MLKTGNAGRCSLSEDGGTEKMGAIALCHSFGNTPIKSVVRTNLEIL
jgi:hypothetical protein